MPATLDDDVREHLDGALNELAEGAQSWAHLSLRQRTVLLQALRRTIAQQSRTWARTAARSKGLDDQHPLRGEEWLSGPYTVLDMVDALIRSLEKLAEDRSPLDGVRLDQTASGQMRAHAFPLTGMDRFLLAGFSGEVWLRPGVTETEARAAAGLAQRTPQESGGIGLVLGAGNITSIPVLDVFYELFAHNRVVILKVNPTQDALVPVYEKALAPLIAPGFVRIVQGGGDVGEYLTTHKAVDHVHITGAEATFNAIVWGTGGAATRRRRENRPKLKKSITAELGGVSPIIVVPGPWSEADLRFHAEHIATMRLQNCGHNCIAGQVVIVSADWPQREQFEIELRRAYASAPERLLWYPKADERMQQAAESYPDAWKLADRLLVEVGPDDDATDLQTTEYFAPVLGVVSLPGTGQEFVDAAVAHANTQLHGTLGANLLIDPATEKALGDGFDNAIARLHYGSIAINAWTAFGFIIPTLTWGAYPGGTLDNVTSGIGVVHNALLLDNVERSVIRGPFRPFPRALAAPFTGDRLTILPTPPWFVSSRTGAEVSEGLTRFRARGGVLALLRTLVYALRA
ncbi:aldehyde dehydrogenase family protein [Microbacterium sp. YY-01]|uniref:aldehyde dehydrogenase family protein n=1 Tax=Microbacterium sp. YY-01 TaxID=3421634 RepID=UPI003D16B7F0